MSVREERLEQIPTLDRLPDSRAISDGIEIRRIDPADAERLFEIITNNPDIQGNVAWTSWVNTLESVIPSLQRNADEVMNGRFAIMESGVLVGYVGIHPSDRAGDYGIGYFLDEAARGKGCAARAIAAAAELARNYLGARGIYLQIIKGNTASEAVAKRLGYQPAETVVGVDFPVEQQRWRLELP